jgi:hypothetical protein
VPKPSSAAHLGPDAHGDHAFGDPLAEAHTGIVALRESIKVMVKPRGVRQRRPARWPRIGPLSVRDE